MAKVQLQSEARVPAKEHNVQAMDISPNANSDVQQVAGKNYDPSQDQRDMKRLGKRQELRVSTHPKHCCTALLTLGSVVFASSALQAMS